MLLICSDPTAPKDTEGVDDVEDWVTEMDGRGVRQRGDRLRPSADATTVTVRGGELVVTDGPFAAGPEWMAGYDIIECADLDEAIEVASKHPMAKYGAVEIRPVWPFEG